MPDYEMISVVCISREVDEKGVVGGEQIKYIHVLRDCLSSRIVSFNSREKA